MMKFFLILFATLLTSISYAKKIAQNYPHPELARTAGSFDKEVFTSSTNGTFSTQKACKDCDSGSSLDVGAAYFKFLQNNIQVGAEGRLRSLSKEYSGTGSSKTLIDILGAGIYNLENDFKNSPYIKAGLGFYSALKSDRSDYESKLGLFVGAGKRFVLLPNVVYAPEIRLTKKGDIDFAIDMLLINVSVHWN